MVALWRPSTGWDSQLGRHPSTTTQWIYIIQFSKNKGFVSYYGYFLNQLPDISVMLGVHRLFEGLNMQEVSEPKPQDLGHSSFFSEGGTGDKTMHSMLGLAVCASSRSEIFSLDSYDKMTTECPACFCTSYSAQSRQNLYTKPKWCELPQTSVAGFCDGQDQGRAFSHRFRVFEMTPSLGVAINRSPAANDIIKKEGRSILILYIIVWHETTPLGTARVCW